MQQTPKGAADLEPRRKVGRASGGADMEHRASIVPPGNPIAPNEYAARSFARRITCALGTMA